MFRGIHDHARVGARLEGRGIRVITGQGPLPRGEKYQIDYINPYDNKRKSVLLHTKEEPEVTELLDIISANC